MNTPTCEKCAYFRQHYSLDNHTLYRVYYGHCTFSRPTEKRPDTKACKNFSPGAPDTEPFATKEYLSKELLRYIFELELLPEIRDAFFMDKSTD